MHLGGPGEVREDLPAALQLEELRASAGGARDNDGVIPNKPLAEVLREAKEAKEEAFQNQWKTMKQGKSCSMPLHPLAHLEEHPAGVSTIPLGLSSSALSVRELLTNRAPLIMMIVLQMATEQPSDSSALVLMKTARSDLWHPDCRQEQASGRGRAGICGPNPAAGAAEGDRTAAGGVTATGGLPAGG